jgi:hypothetical protein
MLDREGVAGPADIALIGDEATVTAQLRRLAEIGVTGTYELRRWPGATAENGLEDCAVDPAPGLVGGPPHNPPDQPRPGAALVQTYNPEHTLMRALQGGDKEGWYGMGKITIE